MTKKLLRIFAVVLCLALLFTACAKQYTENIVTENEELSDGFIASVNDVPKFDGKTPYVEINGNTPFFTSEEITEIS